MPWVGRRKGAGRTAPPIDLHATCLAQIVRIVSFISFAFVLALGTGFGSGPFLCPGFGFGFGCGFGFGLGLRALPPVVLGVQPALAAETRLAPEMLLAGDRAWEDLARLEATGALPVGLTALRPVPRWVAARWVVEMRDAPAAQVDAAALARLEREFAREIRRLGFVSQARETPPALRLADEDADASAGETRLAGEEREAGVLDGARSELRAGPTAAVQARASGGEARFGDSTRAGLYSVLLLGSAAAFQGELWIGEVERGREIGDPLVAHTDVLYFSEEAGAAVGLDSFRLRLARGRHHWGAGRSESLLLDRLAPPLDFLEWAVDLPRGIRFVSWSGTLGARDERGIAAHRLEVPFGDGLRLALSEGVRFTGGLDHPLYLLGIFPYTLVQRFDEQDARDPEDEDRQRNNVLLDLELMARPRPGSVVTLEFLADDIATEEADSPARLAGRLGAGIAPRVLGAPLELRLEGTKVSRYTYAVFYRDVCECDWIQQGRAIGDPDGPDQEALRLWAGRAIGRDHEVALSAIWANRGASPLGEAWVPGGPGQEGLTSEALHVSSPVERERGMAGSWRWMPRDNIWIETIASVSRFRNAGNRPGGETETAWRLELRAAARY
ncbi:MAG: hypothetical protein ACE15D_07415 [Candidatus Eisenbacteria bacterium]